MSLQLAKLSTKRPQRRVRELFRAGALGGMYVVCPATCWQDTAGTVAATVGSSVARLDDISGNGIHLTQATTAAQPILQQDATGRYYLAFDGVDDCLNATTTFTVALPAYMAIAIDRLSIGSSDVFFSLSSGLANYMALGGSSGNKSRMQLRSTARGLTSVIDAGTTMPTGKHVVSALSVAGTCDVFTDGASANTGANSWVGGDTITAQAIRLAAPAGGALPQAMNCYGGIVLLANPGAARATIESFLGGLLQ